MITPWARVNVQARLQVLTGQKYTILRFRGGDRYENSWSDKPVTQKLDTDTVAFRKIIGDIELFCVLREIEQ